MAKGRQKYRARESLKKGVASRVRRAAHPPPAATRKAITVAKLWDLRRELHALSLDTANHKLRMQYERWGTTLGIGLIDLKLFRAAYRIIPPTNSLGAERAPASEPHPKSFLRRAFSFLRGRG